MTALKPESIDLFWQNYYSALCSMPIQASFCNPTERHVSAVIVSFRPDHAALVALIKVIRPQVTNLLIVNNGIATELPDLGPELKVDIHNLGDNHGIAYAQNAGIRRLLANGATHILLLDQDSLPAEDMVVQLARALDNLKERGEPVAAVGPCYVDSRQGEAASFVYKKGLGLKRHPLAPGVNIVKVDFLIASGCLIPKDVFSLVGFMEDEMFIDYVDIEWGLRAQILGFNSYGVYSAAMQHSLGDEWFSFRGRRIPLHSAHRHYYHFRNALWLCKRPWISQSWRAILIIRLLKQFVFFSLVANKRPHQIRMMLLGTWHGLRNRMGRFDLTPLK
ncbi:glycosyltransferase family 2 protein [Rhizobium leguminosarum]|uniref:glycosyltransferase family 2 protein n=1 Tax=Rhizobium leguminosarum TaxID=384 RepID=UPI001FE19592|nr:glycosyltransferase family 2 protein [Rhizobium leguminosarum]